MQITLIPYLITQSTLELRSIEVIVPIGILYLSAFLKKHEHRVNVVDPNLIRKTLHTTHTAPTTPISNPNKNAHPIATPPPPPSATEPQQAILQATPSIYPTYQQLYDAWLDELLKTQSPIFGFSIIVKTFHHTLHIAAQLKQKRPDAIIIFGGPHTSVAHDKILHYFDFVDIVVRGEGELTLLNLVNAIEQNQAFDRIAGITYRDRKNGKICVNPNVQLIPNLDILPIPDYESYPIKEVTNNYLIVDIGRGCPYDCSYCAASLLWERKYRTKSVNRIIEEISYLNGIYKKNVFHLRHDNIAADRKWFFELCNTIIQEKLNIIWSCNARIDNLDNEMLEIMSKAGCTSIGIGIESGSEKIQALTNKKLKLDTILDRLAYLYSCKMSVPVIFFMCGFPQEDQAEVEKTLRLLMNCVALFNGYGWVQLGKLEPFPKTQIAKENCENLVFYPDLVPLRERDSYSQICLDIARQEFDLFPEFYYVKNNFGLDVEYFMTLSKFVTRILRFCCMHYPYSFKVVLNYFDYDFNKLFSSWNSIVGKDWMLGPWKRNNTGNNLRYFITGLLRTQKSKQRWLSRLIFAIHPLRRLIIDCGFALHILPAWLLDLFKMEDIIYNKILASQKMEQDLNQDIAAIDIDDETTLTVNPNVSIEQFNFDVLGIINNLKKFRNKAINYDKWKKNKQYILFRIYAQKKSVRFEKINYTDIEFINLFYENQPLKELFNKQTFYANDRAAFYKKVSNLIKENILIVCQ